VSVALGCFSGRDERSFRFFSPSSFFRPGKSANDPPPTKHDYDDKEDWDTTLNRDKFLPALNPALDRRANWWRALIPGFNPELHAKNRRIMKRAEAKIMANVKENPVSEPDEDPNTWLIEAKLDQDVFEWQSVRLDFRGSEIKAEIVETAMAEPTRCTIRTRGESPLKPGDHIYVDIREQSEL
jgi:hypothetical protein